MRLLLALVLIAGAGAYLDHRSPPKPTSGSVIALEAPTPPTQEFLNQLAAKEEARLRARGGCMKHAKITVTVEPVETTRRTGVSSRGP